MGSVAASGGYYVTLGADLIVANRGSMTGSIGVIIGIFNYNELMGKAGLAMNSITSGEYKDSGSPYEEFTAGDREYFQELVDDIYTQFTADVAAERVLPLEEVEKWANGRVFTGAQALELGLVDTLGTYEDALRMAVELAGLEGEPKVIKERRRAPTLFDLIFGDVRSTINSFLPFPVPEYRLNY